jgi:prepilin-type N-terminal cleavage/methylation domain-containing protein
MSRLPYRTDASETRSIVLDSFESGSWSLLVQHSTVPSSTYSFDEVGTSRCDVPARAIAGGIGAANASHQMQRIATLHAARTAHRAIPTTPRRFLRIAETGRRAGFTLVELLTVIAIIAVLVTLLTTGLTSAKRKARQAACTSNLRQISLALNMYLDDLTKRPHDLGSLVTSKYLPAPAALRCPEDKTGNWGGLVENPFPLAMAVTAIAAPAIDSMAAVAAPPSTPPSNPVETPVSVTYSYLHPLPWEDSAWDRLVKIQSGPGVAVCQLHGLGKPNLSSPSMRDFEGLILRARLDGAVVRRQVYWDQNPEPARSAFGALSPTSNVDYPWRLFTDEPPP